MNVPVRSCDHVHAYTPKCLFRTPIADTYGAPRLRIACVSLSFIDHRLLPLSVPLFGCSVGVLRVLCTHRLQAVVLQAVVLQAVDLQAFISLAR